MLLNDFYSKIDSIKCVKVIQKVLETEISLCNIIGFYIFEGDFVLFVLEYLKNQENYYDEQEAFYSNYNKRTNREKLINNIKKEAGNSFFNNLREVAIGSHRFAVSEWHTSKIDFDNYEFPLLFSNFKAAGWKPKELGNLDSNKCKLTQIKLNASFDDIMVINNYNKIDFVMSKLFNTYISLNRLTLDVGREYNEKIIVKDKDSEKEHWIFINRVYLYDINKEIIKAFDNPKYVELYSEDELKKLVDDTVKKTEAICPKEERLLVVEYESEDIDINLYSVKWLDELPYIDNSSDMWFSLKPKDEYGVLGEKLKVAIIREPFDKNTETVKAEILSFSQAKQKSVIDIDLIYGNDEVLKLEL